MPWEAGQAAAQTAGTQGAASSSSPGVEVDDDVEILGERTSDERNAEGAKEAIDLGD